MTHVHVKWSNHYSFGAYEGAHMLLQRMLLDFPSWPDMPTVLLTSAALMRRLGMLEDAIQYLRYARAVLPPPRNGWHLTLPPPVLGVHTEGCWARHDLRCTRMLPSSCSLHTHMKSYRPPPHTLRSALAPSQRRSRRT